ncbi:CBS domain-containing protein [Candidatus Fermentibacteria bacterium]|nr:CBS domain-containing protein [Candidatus Fermentibacteria bacterium]
MSLLGPVVLLVSLLLVMFSSASRAALPSLIIQEGKDPSERREAAAKRLRVIWMIHFLALLGGGAGIALVSTGQGLVSPWVAAAAIVVGLALLGELIPARLAHAHPEESARILRPVQAVLRVVFQPLALLLLGGSRHGDPTSDEWAITPPSLMWLEKRLEKGDLEEYEQEQELIDSILDFSDKIVREVMIPRIDMFCIEEGDDLQTVVDLVRRAGHSRIPVYREKIDNVVGVLYAKDLLDVLADPDADFRMTDLVREAYFVPEYKRIDDLFKEFQSHRIHMAVVVDEYGGTAGLISMEDIIEEVFGEIVDEHDSEAPLVQSLGRKGYRLDARLPIDDLNDLLGADFQDDDFETLGGMLYQKLERIPKPGESVIMDGCTFTVEKVRAQRILLVKVHQKGPDGPAPEDG